MRKIAKAWPPSNVSPPTKAPCSLPQADQAMKASLPGAKEPARRAREHFDTLHKPVLREALRKEQRWICVYCEVTLADESAPLRIDHWIPVNEEPTLALTWSNIHLSCPNQATCDIAKKGKRLDLPWPGDTRYQDWIGFTTDGEIYVRRDAPIDDATRKALELAIGRRQPEGGGKKHPSILYLNDRALIAARKAAIQSEMHRMEKDFKHRRATPEDRQARAAALLDAPRYPSFVSIRVAYLQRMLGRHKNPA